MPPQGSPYGWLEGELPLARRARMRQRLGETWERRAEHLVPKLLELSDRTRTDSSPMGQRPSARKGRQTVARFPSPARGERRVGDSSWTTARRSTGWPLATPRQSPARGQSALPAAWPAPG